MSPNREETIREILHVRQDEPGLKKRWFRGGGFELFVWLDGVRPRRLQLAYRTESGELCLSWSAGEGFIHEQVDDGETEPLSYKASPILVPDGIFKKNEIIEKFRQAAAGLDPGLVGSIIDIIERYE